MEGQDRKRNQQQYGANEAILPRRKKRKYCGKCIGCLEKEDCRVCLNCKDQQRYGGPNKRHARCLKRQCQKLKHLPNKQTNKKVGRCVSATISGIAGGSEATGNLGADQSVAQTGRLQTANIVKICGTGNNEDSDSSEWSSSDVSEDENQHVDVTGDQQQQQRQQQQKQQQLHIGDLTVELNHSLGDGSFGTVFKASYQGIPAAAKCLYDPAHDEGSFKHELETLQGLIHPNLVTYQTNTTRPGPQSRRRPILVMELMERNLTQFLEEAEHNIPIHLQVNLCLDITFALVYLHSQQIVHGHLTSNNVLLVGTTAKVADFGMSKLLDTQSSVTQPVLYLPPEVRVSHPKFSEKSDVFSFGVLVVQIITREVPTPTPQQQLASLSEVDRRQQHIKKITSTHPLRDIALQCLKDTAMERPTAKQVVTKLNAVRYHPQYEDSLKQEREMAQRKIAQLTKKLRSKEESVLKQKQESEELHHQLKEKEQKIADAEIQHQALQRVLENKSESVRELKKNLDKTETMLKNESKKVQDTDRQIRASKMEAKKLVQQCKEKDVKISELNSTMDKIASLATAAKQ